MRESEFRKNVAADTKQAPVSPPRNTNHCLLKEKIRNYPQHRESQFRPVNHFSQTACLDFINLKMIGGIMDIISLMIFLAIGALAGQILKGRGDIALPHQHYQKSLKPFRVLRTI
ncbi:MAG: hypothetical protein JJU48_05690 [Methylophaga sp.]|nr:hypothetical protein [Methylophaga sp.]